MTAIENARQTLLILLPEILILLSATVMMTAGAFRNLPRHVWSITAATTLLVALGLLVLLRNQVTDPYGAVAVNDAMAGYGRMIFLLTGLIFLGLAHNQVDDERAPEFFGSLLMIHAGAMVVCAANELVFLFVGLELVSIPTYLLLYLPRRTEATQEAATKYFFLSVFSSALLLFGLAYLYGIAGVSNLKALAYLSQVPRTLPSVPHPTLGVVAIVFVMAGLGFRVAAVPFHFYAPDVYQGSPTVIAALLAWIPKAVGFVALLRTLTAVIPTDIAPPGNHLTQQAAVLAFVIATITMTLGNTVALAQTNLKRLFAYSSIAHAGYLMIGITVAFRNGDLGNYPVGGFQPTEWGSEAVLFYLVTYALMTLGAFGVIIGLSSPGRPVETVDDLAGLARKHPILALAMAVCLFSLAGIPPLSGFYGKLNLFVAALTASNGDDAILYQSLALIGALNSAIGAYYYLKIIVAMYFRDPVGPPLTPQLTWPTATSIGTCSVLALLLGVWLQPMYVGARASAESLIDHPSILVTRPAAEDARDAAEAELQRVNDEHTRAVRGLRWATPPATSKRPR